MKTCRTSFPAQSPRAPKLSNKTLMHLLRYRDLWLPPLLVLPQCPSSASLALYTSKFIPIAPLAPLAALALPSWAVLGHLGAIVRRLGAKLHPFGRHLKPSWRHLGRIGSDVARLKVFASSCTHVSHILSHLKVILRPFWPERLPQEPPQNGTS